MASVLHFVLLIDSLQQASAVEQHRFEKLVYTLVRDDHCTRMGDTLLHMCIQLSVYLPRGSPITPTVHAFQTLVTCGADVDAVNCSGESPLIYLLHHDYTQLWTISKEDRDSMAAILLEKGAHADRASHKRYRTVLSELSYDRHGFRPLIHVSLKCLAARAIRDHKVAYNDLDNDLKVFVESH